MFNTQKGHRCPIPRRPTNRQTFFVRKCKLYGMCYAKNGMAGNNMRRNCLCTSAKFVVGSVIMNDIPGIPDAVAPLPWPRVATTQVQYLTLTRRLAATTKPTPASMLLWITCPTPLIMRWNSLTNLFFFLWPAQVLSCHSTCVRPHLPDMSFERPPHLFADPVQVTVMK